jgi:hypothetical protein
MDAEGDVIDKKTPVMDHGRAYMDVNTGNRFHE